MAKIVLGLATSHAPSLNGSADRWPDAGKRDMERPTGGGIPMKLDIPKMIEERASWIGKELQPEVFERRHNSCQAAIETLARTLREVNADVAVVVGDDTHEVFMPEDHIPPIDIFWGDELEHIPHFSREENLKPNIWKGEPSLGRHMVESLVGDAFDISHTRAIAEGRHIGHAFDFVYGRIMQNKVPPHVPLFLNTYYPPNRPTVKRCYALGRSLRRAIESWDSEKTVAVIATGGLSHLVIDEELDQACISAMQAKDADRLAALPEEKLIHGTSEFRNWVVTAGAMHEGAPMTMVAYEPCYRSPAGTGCACAFAYWA
ncbi:MAG: protocatechuate 3,4-dioxygenase [Chloroflexi bacterium]|nr:protocatechuate 3,4-dioxygenase [Chloroflexota bacterium]